MVGLKPSHRFLGLILTGCSASQPGAGEPQGPAVDLCFGCNTRCAAGDPPGADAKCKNVVPEVEFG